MTVPRWIVSVDLGQSIDPTAVAVLEVTTRRAAHALFWETPEENRPADMLVPPLDWYDTRPGGTGGVKFGNTPARIDVRHLARLPLRMSYPDQVAHVASLLRRPPLDRLRPDLVLDQTGVGRPVTDMFRRSGLRPIGCTITAGAAESRDSENPMDWRVAKMLLVSRLQSVFHAGELRISKQLPEAKTLVSELHDFRGIFTDTGYARFGAREGAHDDLVLAVAIGVWWACRGRSEATWGTYVI